MHAETAQMAKISKHTATRPKQIQELFNIEPSLSACWTDLEVTAPCVYLPFFPWPGNLSPYHTGLPMYVLCV